MNREARGPRLGLLIAWMAVLVGFSAFFWRVSPLPEGAVGAGGETEAPRVKRVIVPDKPTDEAGAKEARAHPRSEEAQWHRRAQALVLQMNQDCGFAEPAVACAGPLCAMRYETSPVASSEALPSLFRHPAQVLTQALVQIGAMPFDEQPCYAAWVKVLERAAWRELVEPDGQPDGSWCFFMHRDYPAKEELLRDPAQVALGLEACERLVP